MYGEKVRLMKKQSLYYLLIVLSLLLFAIPFTILKDTKIIAPVIVVVSIYLFLGAIIKLCKTNGKLKDTLICVIDLLFWLP